MLHGAPSMKKFLLVLMLSESVDAGNAKTIVEIKKLALLKWRKAEIPLDHPVRDKTEPQSSPLTQKLEDKGLFF